jgi:hypothetical protein
MKEREMMKRKVLFDIKARASPQTKKIDKIENDIFYFPFDIISPYTFH